MNESLKNLVLANGGDPDEILELHAQGKHDQAEHGRSKGAGGGASGGSESGFTSKGAKNPKGSAEQQAMFKTAGYSYQPRVQGYIASSSSATTTISKSGGEWRQVTSKKVDGGWSTQGQIKSSHPTVAEAIGRAKAARLSMAGGKPMTAAQKGVIDARKARAQRVGRKRVATGVQYD